MSYIYRYINYTIYDNDRYRYSLQHSDSNQNTSYNKYTLYGTEIRLNIKIISYSTMRCYYGTIIYY